MVHDLYSLLGNLVSYVSHKIAFSQEWQMHRILILIKEREKAEDFRNLERQWNKELFVLCNKEVQG